MAFVWEAVACVAAEVAPPLVILVQDAEQCICSSFVRHSAFMSAFGALPGRVGGSVEEAEYDVGDEDLHNAGLPHRGLHRCVLVAGTSLRDTGTHLTEPARGCVPSTLSVCFSGAS